MRAALPFRTRNELSAWLAIMQTHQLLLLQVEAQLRFLSDAVSQGEDSTTHAQMQASMSATLGELKATLSVTAESLRRVFYFARGD